MRGIASILNRLRRDSEGGVEDVRSGIQEKSDSRGDRETNSAQLRLCYYLKRLKATIFNILYTYTLSDEKSLFLALSCLTGQHNSGIKQGLENQRTDAPLKKGELACEGGDHPPSQAFFVFWDGDG